MDIKIDKDSSKETSPKDTLKDLSKTEVPKADGGKAAWAHIDSDLKNALNTWTELTEQLADKMSPEEEQLREIKNILGTLKDKLKEFSDDPKK